MRKKYFYNSIISFVLIVSTILMPLGFLPKKAEAQVTSNLSGYTSGLGPAILTLPQCKDQINSGIKSLFSGIGSLFSSSDTSLPSGTIGLDGSNVDAGGLSSMQQRFLMFPTLKSAAESAATQNNAINTYDPEANKKLDIIDTTTQATRAATDKMNANSTCVQSIGRLIAKMLLQKLTMSTVLWINHGFNGSPSFIQDPKKFFKDIADTEILQFGAEINGISPFSKAWLQNQALVYKNKFADNARYSLNDMIQQTNPEYSAATFQADFSQGGWDAWTAMTQVPANNPLGFKIMADNEIQKRLTGTTQSTAQDTRDALLAANGFLGDKRCVSAVTGHVDPNITWAEDQAAIRGTPSTPLCESWEYVTPGKMIADFATETIGYQNNSLLNVQDLNDAVAAVLDATLNQFSTSIYEKGFANIGDQGSDGTLVFSTNSNGAYRSQTQRDFQPSQLTSSWLSANPDFNIRTDLTQALIDEQRTYSDKLAEQNKELMSTTDGKDYAIDKTTGVSNAYGLMPAIYQLDYCIPGPHPGWEQDSQDTLNKVTNLIVPETETSIKNKETNVVVGTAQSIAKIAGPIAGASVFATSTALGASIGSFAPVIGTVVGAAVGMLVSGIIGLFGGKDPIEKLALYYAKQIQVLTGLRVGTNPKDDASNNILSKQGAVQGINEIFHRYTDRIYDFYNPKLLPTVANEAAIDFNQLAGYGQMMKNNEDKISSLKNTISELGKIKDAIDALNEQYPDGGDDYEGQLQEQINDFGRLSADMVNGDDIASADNILKQIKDKKTYVYDNLLKGSDGCEKQLEQNLPNGPFVKQVYNTKRMTYPFPIIYDYNLIANGADIPDPWNSGIKTPNKMTFNTDNNAQGPGFLSYVIYQDADDAQGEDRIKVSYCTAIDRNTVDDWCMIEVRDLFPLEWGQTTLGARSLGGATSGLQQEQQKIYGGNIVPGSGLFETTIGIY